MSLTRPELRLEIRVDDVVQQFRRRCARIGQAQRQRIARNTRLPVTIREVRVNTEADVPQRFVRRERVDQQFRLTKGVQNAGDKTVVGIMQGGDPCGHLLATRLHGSFAHCREPRLERGFAQ